MKSIFEFFDGNEKTFYSINRCESADLHIFINLMSANYEQNEPLGVQTYAVGRLFTSFGGKKFVSSVLRYFSDAPWTVFYSPGGFDSFLSKLRGAAILQRPLFKV